MNVPGRPILALSALAIGITACGAEPDRSDTAPEAAADAGAAADMQTPVGDIVASAPEYVSVAFENEYIRVLRFDLPPGAALPPHEGAARAIYSLGDYELEWTEGDEPPVTRSWSEGDVHVHEAGVHSARNSGATAADFVVFERLAATLPTTDRVEGAPDLPLGARSLLDGDGFEILEVELQPGETQEMHPGGWRAIYSLSDYTIEWREGGEVGERSWSAGDAHWHEPGPHAASNVGETPARWIVVALER
jgi:hypothetical protein